MAFRFIAVSILIAASVYASDDPWHENISSIALAAFLFLMGLFFFFHKDKNEDEEEELCEEEKADLPPPEPAPQSHPLPIERKGPWIEDGPVQKRS